MHEQVNEKTVALSVKGVKITGRLLAKAMRAFLKRAREPTAKRGRQSVKSLTKQGASLANIEISSDDIGTFKRTARKYNVDFALKRDDSETPPRWIIFFKAKDSQALEAAFKEFSAVTLKHKERKPSMLAKLSKFKELAKSIAAPVKNKNRGEREI
ncbi:MAG: PcfB family protein [Oscillospiraceae bacterium]|nr:PcfB family protein [Oscillospiraceae bacterium]